MKEGILLAVPQQVFAEWTVRQIRRGYGLTPFVGSGLSAASGILTGQDFTNYITWTVYICVEGRDEDGSPARGEKRKSPCHDLRRDGWPEPPTQRQVDEARKWVWQEYLKLCANHDIRINDGELEKLAALPIDQQTVLKISSAPSPDAFVNELLHPMVPRILQSGGAEAHNRATENLIRALGHEDALRQMPPRHGQFATSRGYVTESAIRSLYEWRAALDFLARLQMDHTRHDLPLRLGETADQSVIDRFNIKITHGRRPNLGHNMLCHLASRARINTILTTNFDNLIEEAFAQLGERITVIPVSIRGEMPAPATVLAQSCVIKLHGGMLETRADHSLGSPPSYEDLRRFFEYVRGRPPGTAPNEGHIPSILVVCGYSGNDMRCMEMIKYVLEADQEAKILWICHNQNDVTRVEQLFPEYPRWGKTPGTGTVAEAAISPDANQWNSARVIVTATSRSDLLFYEIYQRLTLSLPRGGFNYQFSSNVPPGLDDPYPIQPAHDSPVPADADASKGQTAPAEESKKAALTSAQDALKDELLHELTLSITDPKHVIGRRILCADGESGLLPSMRDVYREMTGKHRKQGIWLWLGDHDSTTSLAQEFLTVLALRLGRFQLDHTVFDSQEGNEDRSRNDVHRKWNIALGAHDPDYNLNNPVFRLPRETQEYQDSRSSYDKWKAQLDPLLQNWAVNPNNWFIVIDGRNGTGGCAEWEERRWDSSEYQRLVGFMLALQDARNPDQNATKGFHLLYAGFTKDRAERIAERKKTEGAESINEIRKRTARRADEQARPVFGAERLEKLKASYQSTHVQQQPQNMYGPNDWGDIHDVSDDSLWIRRYLTKPREHNFEKQLLEVADRIFPEDPPTAADDSATRKGKEDSDEKEKALRKRTRELRALYGASLFRQSRHFSAFMSEGVYPCPQRYNIDEIDNDWTRYQDVVEWQREWSRLVTAGPLFLGMPGGFSWIYRDMRLELRALIDSANPIRFDKPQAYLYCAREARGRMHYWIGDWYLRAHRATGHAVPLLEALYHFGCGITECAVLRPALTIDPAKEWSKPQIEDYRRRYARRSLFEMTKALRTSRREIQFWMQDPAGDSWFQVRDGEPVAAERFAAVFENLYKEDRSWEPWLQEFADELAQLPQRGRNARIIFQRLPIADDGREPARDGLYMCKSFDVLQEPADWWAHVGARVADGLKEKLVPEYFTALKKILAAFTKYFKAGVPPEKPPKTLSSTLKADLAAINRAAQKSAGHLYVFIQVLSEISYRTAQCAKRCENACYTAEAEETSQEQKNHEVACRKLWVAVSALSWAVLDLCTELPPAAYGLDANLRIKTSTLYGLAMGRLGRFFEAHRRLNEAHGWFSKSEARFDPLQAAMIEIRRGEVHLLEAVRLRKTLDRFNQPSWRDKSGRGNFENFVKSFGQPSDDAADATSRSEQWAAIYLGSLSERFSRLPEAHPEICRELCRIHLAKLDDAWMTLESAERLLTGTTHSTLWWGHLSILKMRVYAEHWWPKEPLSGQLSDLYCSRVLCRSRDHLAAVQNLYKLSIARSRMDDYRWLRLLHYTLQAMLTSLRHLRRWDRESERDDAPEAYKFFWKEELYRRFKSLDVAHLDNPLLRRYHHRIAKLFESARTPLGIQMAPV